MRILTGLLVVAVACSAPDDDSDTDAMGTGSVDTEADTEADTEPAGVAWSGVCTGRGLFVSRGSGTTVTQFQDYDGLADAVVRGELTAGSATCETTNDACIAEWTDQPVEGPWVVNLSCSGAEPVESTFEPDPTSELPNALFASTYFEFETSTLTANLFLSLTPEASR